jgi:hypothetical protein
MSSLMSGISRYLTCRRVQKKEPIGRYFPRQYHVILTREGCFKTVGYEEDYDTGDDESDEDDLISPPTTPPVLSSPLILETSDPDREKTLGFINYASKTRELCLKSLAALKERLEPCRGKFEFGELEADISRALCDQSKAVRL